VKNVNIAFFGIFAGRGGREKNSKTLMSQDKKRDNHNIPCYKWQIISQHALIELRTARISAASKQSQDKGRCSPRMMTLEYLHAILSF